MTGGSRVLHSTAYFKMEEEDETMFSESDVFVLHSV